jgi:hypothetical protein
MASSSAGRDTSELAFTVVVLLLHTGVWGVVVGCPRSTACHQASAAFFRTL